MRQVQAVQQSGREFDVDELEAFVAVAREGSFTVAARTLQKDASVVSKRIKQLEGRLRTPLLLRTTRRVALTEAGELYFHRVQALLEELRKAAREVTDLVSLPQGLLRVSLPTSFGRRRIVPLIPGLLERHPELRIDARFTDRFVDLLTEGYDVAVRLGRMSDSSLTARKVSAYRNVIVASPSYLDLRGRPAAPSDLARHSCLGFPNHVTWPDWRLTGEGSVKVVRPQGRLVSDSPELLLESALQGLGLIMAPDWFVDDDLAAGRLEEVLHDWTRLSDLGIFVVLPPSRLVPAKTRAFVDMVVEELTSHRARPV